VKAIEVAAFGGSGALQLKTVPDPVPQLGQVLIAVSASDVLFVDTMIRSGRGVGHFPVRPPYLPENGVGGKVASVGEGVDSSWCRPDVSPSRFVSSPSAIESRQTVAKTLLVSD
jgi:NADPH2:quinone reductase